MCYEKTSAGNFSPKSYIDSHRLRNVQRRGIRDVGNEKATFQATILEIHDGYYLVEPVAGSTELNSADRITVPMTNMNPSPEPEVGDVLEIEYDGSIAESYPVQITNVYSISVVE